jgi:hypothetical protein
MLGDELVAKQNELVEWTREGLEVAGFEGFQRLAGLSPDQVPQVGGVYVILRPSREQPKFLPKSLAGHFKGRDPICVDGSTRTCMSRWSHGSLHR